MKRLTELSARHAKPRPHQYTLWDGRTGFGLRISPGGTKTWTVMHGVDRRRITIGRYPDLDLKSARKRAEHYLAEITLDRQQPADTPLHDLIELFFKVRCTPQNNKPSTIREYRYIFKRHLTPLLNLKIGTITHQRINRIVDDLAPTPMEANHAFVAFRMLFRFAVQRQLMERNPLDGMSLPYVRRDRDRTLSDDELRAVWHAAQTFPFPFGLIVALLITTGQRLAEVSGLQWNWIDQNNMTITLPSMITKNSTQHTFPYGTHTQAIIERTPQICAFLFPSLDLSAAYVGHNKAKGRLDLACPLPHWTLHDLRRTFATIHARIGTPPHVTEALLNHKTGSRTPLQRIYDRHDYLPQMRSAIENFDTFLRQLLSDGGHASALISTSTISVGSRE